MKSTILLLCALLLISCGAKKSARHETKTDVTIEATAAAKLNAVTTTDVQQTSDQECDEETTTETVEPIDSAKPVIFEDEHGRQQKMYNGKKKTTKTKTKSKATIKTAVQAKAVVAAEKKSDLKAADKSKSSASVAEREPVVNWSAAITLIIVICATLGFAYFIWKENKEDENKA